MQPSRLEKGARTKTSLLGGGQQQMMDGGGREQGTQAKGAGSCPCLEIEGQRMLALNS